ncbi:MAG: SPOR domain-containing protein [Treponema sp.]|jgi:DedD protein|nr:SPOR domain-containing protein [Treponema sp.]
MEKEMKKLLLVAISVGVFLIVIVSAAILILTPRVQTEQPAFSSSRPITAGRPVQEQSEISVINNSWETTSYINSEGTNPSVETDKSGGVNVTIQIPKPVTAAVPAEPAPVTAITPKPAETPASKPAANSQPAVKPTPAAKPVSTAVKQPVAAKPAVKPAPVKNDYWVQTGAFTAKIRAENAKEKLASKGITSIIENRLVDGKDWYRVRLGPYTSENEAKYWLTLVQSIDGFGESQVRQTAR